MYDDATTAETDAVEQTDSADDYGATIWSDELDFGDDPEDMGDTGADDDATQDNEDDDRADANREAAKWRRKLRAAEDERNALAARLRPYLCREAESVVGDLLEMPTDLWDVAGVDVCDFYDEHGTLNEAELRAAAGALLEMRPRLARAPQPVPTWGQNSGALPGGPIGWNQVLGDRR